MPSKKLFSGPDDRRIKRALCIVAHPDDIEFYCGGSVLKMTRRGVRVDFVLATSGDKGSRNPNIPHDELARQREREQEAAAYVLGAVPPADPCCAVNLGMSTVLNAPGRTVANRDTNVKVNA